MNKRLLTLLVLGTAVLTSSTAIAQTGGPDPFGYSFAPATFDWVPLASEPAATAHNTGDDGVASVTLPWTFSWYGVDYTEIAVGTNGGISFGPATALTFGNTCLPSAPAAFGAADLMVFWDDMNQASGGNVYSWHDAVGGRMIVSWEDVPRYFAVDAGSFQVHLYPGGAVEFHWQDTDFGNPLYDNGANATVGIQDLAGGTQGSGNWLEWSCNTASIVDGTAASFSSCTDADGDGAGDPACGGLDCDDNDPTVYPGALELCDGLDTDCDPLTSETVDGDGDGETVCAGDCDDTDAANSSLLPEVCDGADNDCNGTADADVAGEVDVDTDGVLSCEDCDDTDSAVFPGAIEICNGGIDDDCDAATDEAVDFDGDGVSACGPDGIADTADDDCNDGEATVYPGATELCDGLDNDCDELMLGGGSQVVASLTTTMAAGNGSSGNVFDLVAINALSITSFDINASSAGAGTVDVYTMTGTSIGNHQAASLWTLHETVAVTGMGTGVATPVPLVTPIDLAAGGTYGIYIHSSLGIQYTNGTSLPVPSPSVLFASDANLEFYEGYGMGAPVFGTNFYPRVWNGTIHYGDGVNLEGDGDGDGYVECVWLGSDPAIIGGDDCNDGAATIYPGAPELCDGEDTDCDPTTDELVDVDGDLDTVCDGDCDETDPTIGPSQTEIGCDGIDNDCDAATIDSGDGDGDGVDVCAGDCDDLDPLAFPGAPEICGDGIDQDCDSVDTVVDVDGDGFSDSSCGGLDCDDTAVAVFPGAVEVLCDGVDNDCDPLTLNENDADLDGVTDCGVDGALGTADDDCDDTDAAVFPGNVEICNGGIDDDCDAATDETVDFDTDGVSACGPDGLPDTADDDCNDGEATVYPGATELCDGLDNDCDELMLGGGSQATFSLTTTMVGGNGSSGNAFDLVAINDLSITSFDVHTTAAGAGTIEVYTMTGTSIGNNQSAAGWTLHETVAVTGNSTLGGVTPTPLVTPIDLVAGTTTGIYIHSSLGIRYTNGTALPLPSPPVVFASDANLEIYEGYGMGAPVFTGASFYPRVWNGTIHYGDGVNLEGDSDGDGYVECVWLGSDPAIIGGDDCNDGAATIYPGAPELCDGEDTDCDPSTDENVDVDGDLDTLCDGDCDETDPTIGPSQTEIGCDGIDQDCDPLTLDQGDGDSDGVDICAGDCDDSDPLTYPGAPEVCGDGIDQDCDLSDYIVDADGDGYSDSACGGDDCDDADSAISPAGVEALCDGVDNDCDPLTLNENDVDTDGTTDCGPDGVLGTADDDCDDTDATVFPGNPEACDGEDNDCDGLPLPDEVDLDGDGEMVCAGDCDDTDPDNFTAGTEMCDGFDNDCDGLANFDAAMEMDFDGDGWLSCEDCADNAAENFPGNIEICDGLDNDCNGLADFVGQSLGDDDDSAFGDDDDSAFGDDDDSALGDDDDSALGDDDDSAAARGGEGTGNELDVDGDGFLDCDDDCDDGDATINPIAQEVCDGLDQDCDGVVPADESDDDADGMRICDGDCDDSDPATYDGAPEVCDGVDNDCDGAIDDEELDTDGDGYSPCDGDCDDTTADSNPEAEEICDGLDNDCDDAVPTEESDADGDGFLLCADDCDDADDTISPDASEDTAAACDDELDNDCDGLTDLDDEDCDDFITDAPIDSSDCDCSVVSGGGSAGLGLLVLGLLGLVRRRTSGLVD